MEVQGAEVEGNMSFDFAVHLPEPPHHQAQPGPPEDLGTSVPAERWTRSSLAA